MRVIGSEPIWNEPFGELVLRWFKRQPVEVREAIGGPAEAQLRVERRAALVLEHSGLQPARPLVTPREWETRWDARATWERLVAHTRARGWDVLLEPGTARGTRWAPTALAESEERAIVISEQVVEDLGRLATDSGCLLGLTTRDLAPVVLAREVYALESPRIGNPPPEWVEQLAAAEFARRALGLPFHPMIFDLLAPNQ
jgi:hypothetical protein